MALDQNVIDLESPVGYMKMSPASWHHAQLEDPVVCRVLEMVGPGEKSVVGDTALKGFGQVTLVVLY